MDHAQYILMAAQHSRHNAGHWFRYLRKLFSDNGTSIPREVIEQLITSDILTPFQRVSLKAALREGSETRKHIIGLNQRVVPSKLASVRAKHGL